LSVDNYVREELNSIKSELDKLISQESLDSHKIDYLRDIQYLLNEASKIEEKNYT